jgi:hypothetical protein
MNNIRDRVTSLQIKLIRTAQVAVGILMSATGIGYSARALMLNQGASHIIIGGAILIAGGVVLKSGITGDGAAIARVRQRKALREARREAWEAGRRPPVELSEKESIRRLKQDLERGSKS